MKDNNLLILTGASGFIGNYCQDYFNNLGYRIITVGRSPSNDFYCDLSSPESIHGLHKLPTFGAFIHLATHVGWDGAPSEKLFAPNVLSTALIADFVRNREAHLIFSSAAVIAGQNMETITMSSMDNPDCCYAESKLLAENCILFSGVDASILRIGGVYGLNGPQHLGLNRNIQLVSSGHSPLVFGTGSGRRNYIYVRDLADIIANTIETRCMGVHLVAGKESLSIHQICQQLSNVFDISSGPVYRSGESSRSQIVESAPQFTGKSTYAEAFASLKTLDIDLNK